MKTRPAFLDALLERLVARDADVILGDLDEEWPDRVHESGRLGAFWWYVKTVVAATAGSPLSKGRTTVTSERRRPLAAGWWMELRYEARAMMRTPVWSTLAMVTVSIGMVFAVLVLALAQSMRTQLVPYPEAERLYSIAESNGLVSAVADPTLRQLQDRSALFEAVGAWSTPQDANLNRPDADPTVVRAASVLPGTFEMLGYAPIAGRALQPSDEDPGGGISAVISYGFWQRGFAGSEEAVGATINVNGRTFEVVGVMPADARLPDRGGAAETDVWMPILRLPSLATDPGLRYQVVARSAHGTDRTALAAGADQIMNELRETLPQWRTDPSWHMVTQPLRAELEGNGSTSLRALGAATLLLLALAAANLTALTLARAQARCREFIVHTALGAPPSIALRRLLAQNAIVAAGATALAVLVGAWALAAAQSARPGWIPGVQFARIGILEAAATFAGAVLLCSVVAVACSRLQPRLAEGLEALRARGPRGRWKLVARGLVLVETCLVVSLAIGAGLVGRSLFNLHSVDMAVPLENRITARVSLNAAEYPDSQSVRRFTDAVLERLDGAPGIDAAAAATSAPFARAGWNFVILEGHDPEGGQLPTTELQEVTPGYFEALGLPLVQGRGLEGADYRPGAEPVVVINETLAALYDGEGAVVGRSLNFTGAPLLRVVGVVRNSPAGRLDEPPGPWVYVADMDNAFPWTMRTRWFVLRLADEEHATAAASLLRTAVAEVDDAIPVHPPRLLTDLRQDLLRNARFSSVVFGFLGLVALLLGTAGIFGVVSHTLAAARRETGIRLALGATRSRVFAGTVAAEAVAVGLGAGLGLVAAWQLGAALATFLYGVTPGNIAVYGVALVAVGGAAALAIIIPAYRFAAADPSASLRNDF